MTKLIAGTKRIEMPDDVYDKAVKLAEKLATKSVALLAQNFMTKLNMGHLEAIAAAQRIRLEQIRAGQYE